MTSHRLSLPYASLDWKDETPVSRVWDDVYFNIGKGLEESRTVFLEGSGLPALWHETPYLVVGETGFGSGLNFLALWQAWSAERATAQIHFISTESRPMRPEDMARALKPYPELARFSSALVAQWPPAFPGLHQLIFEGGKIQLTLCFGDASTMLSHLECQMDAWFLDGFAPARNPEMWQKPLYTQLARLSKPDARLATFTAAGHVRRGLEDAGFIMEKRPGFDGKRERLTGRFKGKATTTLSDNIEPWFAMPPISGGPVAIIGDGIAAHWLIAACRQQGLNTIQIAQKDQERLPAAILTPRLDLGSGAPARLAIQSLLHCWRAYDALDIWAGPRGVLCPLVGKTEQKRSLAAIEALNWPQDLLQHLSSTEASALLGSRLNSPALYWPKAGCVIPELVIEALGRADSHIEARADRIRQCPEGWQVLSEDGVIISSTPSLVVAAGPGTQALLGPDMPMTGYRHGQIACLPPAHAPEIALGHRQYLIPTLKLKQGDTRIMGSSFRIAAGPNDLDLDEDKAANSEMTAALGHMAPDMPIGEPVDHWSGLRLVSPDHQPFMGPVIDHDWIKHAYAPARLDKRRRDLPPMRHKKGLYLLSGLGARGFQTAPLLAHSLACQIAGRPAPLERAQRHALHPARILMRQIIRGEISLD